MTIPDFTTDIALIKQKSEFIEKALIELTNEIKKDGILKREEFEAHTKMDHWMFGIIITILGSIVLKLFGVI